MLINNETFINYIMTSQKLHKMIRLSQHFQMKMKILSTTQAILIVLQKNVSYFLSSVCIHYLFIILVFNYISLYFSAMRSTSSTSMKPVKDFDWKSLLIPIPKTQQQPGAATATTTKQSKATKSKPVKCSLCAVVLKNKYLLKRHVLSQHRLPHENHLTCTMCDSTFFRTEELKRHTIRHKRYSDIGQPLLSCHICHSKFLESEVLKQHIQGVHKDL